jgi:hypothetical protein
LVLRPHSLNRKASEQEDIIPLCVLKQWFGEERLPEGWWGVGGSQPIKQVGLLEARKRAEDVRKVIHDASQWYVFLLSSSIHILISDIDSINACELLRYFCHVSIVYGHVSAITCEIISVSIDAVRPRVPLAAGAFYGLKFFRFSECLRNLRSPGLVALLQLGLPSSFSYSEPVPASRSIPLLYL